MTTEAVSLEDLTLLLWGLRAFLVVVNLLLVCVLLACWWIVAGRAFAGLWQGWRAGDLWLAFLPNERGEWGPFASDPGLRGVFSGVRERGSSTALAWRWGLWMVAAVTLTVGVAGALWGVGRMLVLVWV